MQFLLAMTRGESIYAQRKEKIKKMMSSEEVADVLDVKVVYVSALLLP